MALVSPPFELLSLSHGLRCIVEGPQFGHQVSGVQSSIDCEGLGNDQQGLCKPRHWELLSEMSVDDNTEEKRFV